MFIGHFAVGFASKKFAPRASMAVLLAAPLLSDLLWPIFLLLGWEHVRIDPGNTRFTPLDLYDFPWSHSLVTNTVWAIAFALIYWLWKHDTTGALVVWIGVLSHWLLDWITHRPDMPLYPGGHQRYGLSLWNFRRGYYGRRAPHVRYRCVAVHTRYEAARPHWPLRVLGVCALTSSSLHW
jgi:membrane-bound metal-dependent hydrolase YbcI (DUF457 family)